jgi:P27 family predicted phage terminase small subunit
MSILSPGANARANRLPPPVGMEPEVATVWRRLVGACAPDHFTAADVELLSAYVEAAVMSREAFQQMREHGRIIDKRASPWLVVQEKSVRAMSALAPKLRLGPSARTDPKTTARAQNGLVPSIYDRLNLDDAEQ